jgi:hypothetical protein
MKVSLEGPVASDGCIPRISLIPIVKGSPGIYGAKKCALFDYLSPFYVRRHFYMIVIGVQLAANVLQSTLPTKCQRFFLLFLFHVPIYNNSPYMKVLPEI